MSTRFWMPLIAVLLSFGFQGCGNGGSHHSKDSSSTVTPAQNETSTVTASAGPGGSIAPASALVSNGETTQFTITPDPGYQVTGFELNGCSGTFDATTFTTDAISSDCQIVVNFSAINADGFEITATASAGGVVTPSHLSVASGATAVLTLVPDAGYSVTAVAPAGCTGTLSGLTFTTYPITANCTIAASFAQKTYTVSATAGSGGQVTPLSQTVTHGQTVQVTLTANSGFSIAGVSATGCSGTLAGSVFTTNAVTSDCTLTALFSAPTYKITASTGAGGTITPTSTLVAQGASTTFVIAPQTGYAIADVTATGCTGTLNGTTYSTGAITADCTLNVTFVEADTLTVTASAGTGGSITPTSVSIVSGATVTFTVYPQSGYAINTVTANGCNGTLVGNTFTTDAVTTNCNISATFSGSLHSVTASADANGTISPPSSNVTHGESVALTLTPNSGYRVANVTTTGCTGTLSQLTVTTGPITADCAVAATFAPALASTRVTRVATGGSHSCALTEAGEVLCWGDNFFGELGIGSTTRTWTPIPVAGIGEAVTTLATGAQHTCVATVSGAVYCWGYNAYGQLGNGSTTNAFSPTLVANLDESVSALATGGYHTCALTVSGAVRCWGYNANGQLGNGNLFNSTVPVTVAGLNSSAASIVAGAQHSCALLGTGEIQCWGNNSSGQLGDGTSNRATSPVAVIGLGTSAIQVATGQNHSCALTNTNALMCWGSNAGGQLGSAVTTGSKVPVAVIGTSGNYAAIAAGNVHTCATTDTASVQCWGTNTYGQLGSGTSTNSTAPVTVAGLSTPITTLATGYGHNCVVTPSAGVQCWGYNLYGQLGNATMTNASTPVSVLGTGANP